MRDSLSAEVSWQRSRLLRFRGILENLEYEYSLLLQSTQTVAKESEFAGVELSDQYAIISQEPQNLLRRSSEVVTEAAPCLDNMLEENEPIPKERVALPAGESPVRDTVRFASGSAGNASLERVSVLSSSSQKEELRMGSLWSRSSHRSNYLTSSERTDFSEFGRFRRSRRRKAFPVWWNPDKEALKEMMLQSAATEHRSSRYTKHQKHCVLSPMAFPKLHWDFLGFAIIFYDSWATPFQMMFSSGSLELVWMRYGDIAITLFFTLDIILNFNTALVVKRGICCQRDQIVRQYIQSWFWLDLAATIPYDLIYQGASFAGLLRFLKIIKFLKTIRLIRLMRTLKSLQRTENVYFEMVAQSKNLVFMLGILLVLLLNVHFFCCMWLVLSDAVHVDSFSEAMHVYFETYVAVFLALLNGTGLHGQTTSKKLVEMVIAAEQFIILCLFGAYAIFEALVLYGDTAKSRLLRDQVQRYMGRHGLPVKTQIEVLSGLEEARSARALQKDFIILTSSDLPQELQQKIAFELWENNLMKLALFVRISDWDEDFLHSLTLLCREEVFATDVVLFREHDLSIAAYYVVTGELKVTCTLLDNDIPSFKDGTWVGESSLINPSFRRGLKVVSLCLSSVMVVSSTSFQTLLKESNLWHHFEDFMNQELSHGLCGRCGSIGDHFFDSCPAQHVQWISGFATAKKSKCPCWPYASRADCVVDQANIRELVDYLYHFDALHLLSHLQELNVYSLTELQVVDIDSMSAMLEQKDPPGELSRRDQKVLSARYITMYRDAIAKGMKEECAIEDDRHLLFLSHYKVEAGTEAALMRSELEQIMGQSLIEDYEFKVPIFLDSEDLTTLSQLEDHVKKSFNIVLLLTRGVLSRPWVLVELVTAVRCGIPVVPVQVVKPGVEFRFPTESDYADLLAGKLLDEAGKQLLLACDIGLALIEKTLRNVFQNIAVIYSPHRPAHVRQAELQELLRSCKIEGSTLYDMMNIEAVHIMSSTRQLGSRTSMTEPSVRSAKSKPPQPSLESPWAHHDFYNKSLRRASTTTRPWSNLSRI